MSAKAQDLNLVGNVRAIKAEIARLQGLLDEAAAELLDQSKPVAPSTRAPAQRSRLRARSSRLVGGNHPAMELVPDSAAFWAAEAIRSTGKPLRGRDLVRVLEQRGHKIKESTLVGSLYRWVKKKAIFYRAGKGTFGLIEMKKG